MDYVENSIQSIKVLRIWALFNEQFLPSNFIERNRRDDRHFSNLLEQLWGTEKMLSHLSSRSLLYELSRNVHGPLLRELDEVVGRAVTLVKDWWISEVPTCRRERYSGEHYLGLFLDLRWWTWVVMFKVEHTTLNGADNYFGTLNGVLGPDSSRLPSFVRKLQILWWSWSDVNVRHLPSYGFEMYQQRTGNLDEWLKMTDNEEILESSDIYREIRLVTAETFVVELKGLVPVLGARKPLWVSDELKIDLTQVVLGVSYSALVIKWELDSGLEYALKRVNNVKQKLPLLARLSHPHIIQLIDYWRENDFLFLVMELMEGDLEELIAMRAKSKRSPAFAISEVVNIMSQIAKAMCYLHDMGVTHPHLKSSNVLFKERIEHRTKPDKDHHCYLVKLGGFRYCTRNDFESMGRNVYQFGLICLEVLAEEPIHWGSEEPVQWESEEPIQCFDAIQSRFGSLIPEMLTRCIKRCLLDGNTRFPEIVLMLLLAQVQVLTKVTEESSPGSPETSEQTLLAKHQDQGRSSSGCSQESARISEPLWEFRDTIGKIGTILEEEEDQIEEADLEKEEDQIKEGDLEEEEDRKEEWDQKGGWEEEEECIVKPNLGMEPNESTLLKFIVIVTLKVISWGGTLRSIFMELSGSNSESLTFEHATTKRFHRLLLAFCIAYFLLPASMDGFYILCFLIMCLFQFEQRDRNTLRRVCASAEWEKFNDQEFFDEPGETSSWLNESISRMWLLNMKTFSLNDIFGPMAPYFFDRYKPTYVKRTKIDSLHLGSRPPIFSFFRTLKPNADGDDVAFEATVEFLAGDDMSAQLFLQMTSGFRTTLHISNLHIEGKVRISIKFAENWPCVERVRFCFTTAPQLRMSCTTSVIDFGINPIVSKILEEMLTGAIEENIVQPNVLEVDINALRTWFSSDKSTNPEADHGDVSQPPPTNKFMTSKLIREEEPNFAPGPGSNVLRASTESEALVEPQLRQKSPLQQEGESELEMKEAWSFMDERLQGYHSDSSEITESIAGCSSRTWNVSEASWSDDLEAREAYQEFLRKEDGGRDSSGNVHIDFGPLFSKTLQR